MTLTATTQPIFSPRPKPVLTRPIEIREGVAMRPGILSDDPSLIEGAPPPRMRILSDRPAPVLTTPIPAPLPTPDLPRVVSIGSILQGGRWRTEAMRSHSRPVLYWFTRGQGRATISGRTRGFTPHTAFLLPPGTMHGFDMIGQVTGMLVFLPRAMAGAFGPDPLRLSFRDGQRQMELTALIDALRAAADIDDALADEALGHHAGLLAIWLKRAESETAVPAGHDLARRFTAMIETDFGRGLTVADYAARIGVTPTHLSRVCRAACGRSAHTILTSRRLYEAQTRLADGTDPVAEIAHASGFGSPAYFARAFRKATGRSPSDFRRSASRQIPFPT